MKYCKKCGVKVNPEAKFCTNCGEKQEVTEVVTNTKKKFPAWGIVLIILGALGFLGLIGLFFVSVFITSFTTDLQENLGTDSKTIIEEIEEITDKVENKATYTFDETFEFDDLKITLGSGYSFKTINNEFSEYNQATVVEIPITIVNDGDNSNSLNMFYYTIFGPDGTQLDPIYSYFDNDVNMAGNIRPEATQNSYLHLLYEGNGDYYIEFDNIYEKFEVKLPITKS